MRSSKSLRVMSGIWWSTSNHCPAGFFSALQASPVSFRLSGALSPLFPLSSKICPLFAKLLPPSSKLSPPPFRLPTVFQALPSAFKVMKHPVGQEEAPSFSYSWASCHYFSFNSTHDDLDYNEYADHTLSVGRWDGKREGWPTALVGRG